MLIRNTLYTLLWTDYIYKNWTQNSLRHFRPLKYKLKPMNALGIDSSLIHQYHLLQCCEQNGMTLPTVPTSPSTNTMGVCTRRDNTGLAAIMDVSKWERRTMITKSSLSHREVRQAVRTNLNLLGWPMPHCAEGSLRPNGCATELFLPRCEGEIRGSNRVEGPEWIVFEGPRNRLWFLRSPYEGNA